MNRETSVLTGTVNEAKARGRTARVPFVTAGIPDPESFWGCLEELSENGADIIEIGVPFSDPVADG
ncbi:MAG: tryptophan synthase subunit alpha, partial [Deltaproteobacteria bacterium]|nr:tryptophan synthase subunit alpha [Deltaproteobacteria bacterium]